MIHPAIVAYRMRWRITPNAGRRREIILTIEPEGLEGIRLWNDILNSWKGNPQNFTGLLGRYESLLEVENELRHR